MVKINYANAKISDICPIKRCLKYTLKYLGQPSNVIISVNFVDKNEIAHLNKQNRNIDAPTDVLSFPFLELQSGQVIHLDTYENDIDYSTGRLLLGEMYICRDIAIAQAAEYGHSVKREICFLCVHSLLHLLGYDHEQTEERLQMEKLQEDILDKLGIKR